MIRCRLDDREVFENKHSIVVVFPLLLRSLCICTSIHPEGKSCGHIYFQFECLFSMTSCFRTTRG